MCWQSKDSNGCFPAWLRLLFSGGERNGDRLGYPRVFLEVRRARIEWDSIRVTVATFRNQRRSLPTVQGESLWNLVGWCNCVKATAARGTLITHDIRKRLLMGIGSLTVRGHAQ